MGKKETLTFEHKEDPERYMRVLDTCIDHYKTESSYFTQVLISNVNVMISILVAFSAVYLTLEYTSIVDPIQIFIDDIMGVIIKWSSYGIILGIISLILGIISILILAGTLLIIFLLSYLIFSWISRILKLEEILGVNDTKKTLSKLNALYLAKLEPEKWRLIVTVVREGTEDIRQGIKEVEVKLIESLEDEKVDKKED